MWPNIKFLIFIFCFNLVGNNIFQYFSSPEKLGGFIHSGLCSILFDISGRKIPWNKS